MRSHLFAAFLSAALPLAATSCRTAEPAPAPPPAPIRVATAPPPANPDDVASIDALLRSTYAVISGPAGEPRDWDRLLSLFVPGVAQLSTVARDESGRFVVRSFTPQEYIERAGPFFQENGFWETEVSRRVERFGHIAHVFSTYESRSEPDGEPFERGINSFQLFWDEERWWVLSIYWDREGEGQPIPEEYLGSSDGTR